MEHQREYKEVTDSYEQYHCEYGQRLVPHPPGFYVVMKWALDKSERQTARKGYSSEQQRHQEFIALIHAEPEWLQKIKNQEDYNTIYKAVSKPVTAKRERVFAS